MLLRADCSVYSWARSVTWRHGHSWDETKYTCFNKKGLLERTTHTLKIFDCTWLLAGHLPLLISCQLFKNCIAEIRPKKECLFACPYLINPNLGKTFVFSSFSCTKVYRS